MAGLLILAVAPSIAVLLYVWKKDRIEKEPIGLLLKMFLLAGAATIAAGLWEMLMSDVVLSSIFYRDTVTFKTLENIMVVGLAEEFVKYFVLKKCSWKSPAFDYTFDGVVYAVVTSLGFATIENIMYVTDLGVSTGIARAVTSIPGHAAFGVFMGYYYGLAKYAEARNDKDAMKSNLRKALWIPVLIHGFYDLCISLESWVFLIVFAAFFVSMVVFAIKKIKALSGEDMSIMGDLNFLQSEMTNQKKRGLNDKDYYDGE